MPDKKKSDIPGNSIEQFLEGILIDDFEYGAVLSAIRSVPAGQWAGLFKRLRLLQLSKVTAGMVDEEKVKKTVNINNGLVEVESLFMQICSRQLV